MPKTNGFKSKLAESTLATRAYLQVPSELRALRAEQLRGFTVLGPGDYWSPKPVEKIFIFGSGASVLDLAGTQWDEIENFTSIGLNSWLFHTYVPTFLAYEDIHSSRLMPQKQAMEAGLQRISSSGLAPAVLKFRTPESLEDSLRLNVPPALRGRIRSYGRLQTLAHDNSGSYHRGLLRLYRGDSRGWVPSGLLIDNGGSVARAVHFAKRLGAKHVILVGIDLGFSQYFYEADPTFLLNLGLHAFSRTQAGSVHGTEAHRRGSLPMSLFLSHLRTVLHHNFGIALWAANPSKALIGTLPEWKP